MTHPVPIFRVEALRSRDAQPTPARPQRPEPPRWIAVAYWALLALMAAGLAAGLLVRVGSVAQGPAVIRDGVVQAAVPAAFAADLHPGLPLKLTRPGRPPVTVVLTATGPEMADAQAASTLLQTKINMPGPILLIKATVPQLKATRPQYATPGTTGTVEVQVDSRPLIEALITSLATGADNG